MPTLHGMAQVWLTCLFIVMVVGAVVSDGNERGNMALVAIIALIALVGATKQQRRH